MTLLRSAGGGNNESQACWLWRVYGNDTDSVVQPGLVANSTRFVKPVSSEAVNRLSKVGGVTNHPEHMRNQSNCCQIAAEGLYLGYDCTPNLVVTRLTTAINSLSIRRWNYFRRCL